MSETQVLAPTLISELKKINESEPEIKLVSTPTATTANNDAVALDDDEDLEDGEIDDDDEDNDVIAVPVNKTTAASSIILTKDKNKSNDKLNTPENVVTIELSDDNGPPPTLQAAKNKKPKPVEDDHLSSIENALASALKKKGIEPVAPVLETLTIDDHDENQTGQQGSSRSSRRRKRKKQREEKDKTKSHSEKKKSRYDSPESSKPMDCVDLDDELMDDYEMLNVRGGSPPPVPVQMMPTNFNEKQHSDYESDYSYDSYDSANEGDSPRNDSRRRRRNKKDKKRNRERSGRNDKRHRRADTPERQEPRKLELCKFYLLECCAKRDKCSYMHGDFPCKYYYLGMDCVEKNDCKFSHGEPLTEQLRNILIKHLEMAPKEILGNFKRIPREQAISQITKRHEELCKEYDVKNSWSNLTNLPSNYNRPGKQQQKQQKQKQQQQQQQLLQQHVQQKQQQQQNASLVSNIPSLLDMVIKPPNELSNLLGNNSPSHDRQRKSRWNDSSSTNENHRDTVVEAKSPSVGPSYLNIKNLNGILSDEHIKALSASGISNLEQINQLTVGQLDQIGLTIAEINEIQLKAKNMVKSGGQIIPVEEITAKLSPKTETSSSQPGPNAPSNTDNKTTVQIVKEPETFSTNSNSNSNSGVVMVDYTQYLKDSHLPFDRNDDDEKDDEQLVIDDGNLENDDSAFGASPSKSEMKRRKDSQSDSEQQQQNSHRLSMPTLQMSDFSNALRNPFSASNPFSQQQTQDPRAKKQSFDRVEPTQKNPIALVDTDSDDERYYASRGRRKRSVTPPPHSGSSTPEASQSPRLEEFGSSGATVSKSKPRANPKYERHTMYDFNIKRAAEEDKAHAAKSIKADKDMRFPDSVGIGGDVDLRLPFLPVTNYTPATEIDASITSHLPMTYKVHEVDVKEPCYVELRQNFKSDQTGDPRLRRILGLPETSQTRTSAAVFSRNVRKLSNTIASPESSDGASPKYYTPPTQSADERSLSNTNQKRTEEADAKPTSQQQRVDPRRAAKQNTEPLQSSPTVAASATTQPQANNAVKQNVEIRNHLQKSDWYKNLSSKFKIMVNQQLALVSTELKKFHQDPSPNKIFDISFIVNNATLQQILTQLGIFIDDNGEVAHIDVGDDAEEVQRLPQEVIPNNNAPNILLPNLSQPPPIQQPQQQPIMEFLRGPPPLMPNQGINLQHFTAPPPNVRPSLLGLPPTVAPRNPFNPFAQNMPISPFVGGPSLLGPGPGAPPVAFNTFNAPPNMQQQQQRNFNNNVNQQRNQRSQRRNNNGMSGNSNK